MQRAESTETTPSSLRREDFGGGRLLASDLRVAHLMVTEARHRTMQRLLGVPRDQQFLASLVVLLALAEAAQEKTQQMLSGPAYPSLGDTMLGISAWRELIQGIAGPTSRDTPLFGTLVTIAVLGALSRPALARSAHGVKVTSHRLRLIFNHRYGHLIGRARGR